MLLLVPTNSKSKSIRKDSRTTMIPLLLTLCCTTFHFSNSLSFYPHYDNTNDDGRRSLSDDLGFGNSIDLSAAATNLIVGAPKGSFALTNSGFVKIYTRDDTTWTNVLLINGVEENAELGYSVAFVGDGETYAVAGAPGQNSDAGNVYLMSFDSTESTWSNTQNIAGLDPIPISGFVKLGFSLSGSRATTADTFIVGAPGDSTTAGHAYIFSITSTTAITLISEIEGDTVGDETGYLVSASRNGLWYAISTGENQENFQTISCVAADNCASVPTLNIASGLEESTSLSIDQIDGSGPSVVLSGTGTDGNGVVQLYGCDNVEGLCLGLTSEYVHNCADDEFGFSTMLNEPTIVVGSPNWKGKGEIFLFEDSLSDPLTIDDLDFAGEDCGEEIGRSVALSSNDDSAFVAAGGNGYVRVWNEAGDVYGEITPFETSRNLRRERKLSCSDNCVTSAPSFSPTSTNEPTPTFSFPIHTPDDIGFGNSIDLSAAATNLIVGAPYGSFGGANSGFIKMYTRDDTTWTNVFQLNGEAHSHFLGYSVAFVGDGETYAVAGAPGYGFAKGNVYLMSFDSTESTWSNTQNISDLDPIPISDEYLVLGFSLSGSRTTTADTFIVGAPGHLVPFDTSITTTAGHAYIFSITSTTEMTLISEIDGADTAGEEIGYLVSASRNGLWYAISGGQNQTSFQTISCVAADNCASVPTLNVEIEGSLTESTSLSIDQIEGSGPTVVVSGTGTDGNGVVQFYGCDNVEGLCLGLKNESIYECADNLYGYSSLLSQNTILVGSPDWDGEGRIFLFEGYEFDPLNTDNLAGENCGEEIGRSVALSSDDDYGSAFVAAGGNGYVRVWNEAGDGYGEITSFGDSRNFKRESQLSCSNNCTETPSPTTSPFPTTTATTTPSSQPSVNCGFCDQLFTALLNVYAPFFPTSLIV